MSMSRVSSSGTKTRAKASAGFTMLAVLTVALAGCGAEDTGQKTYFSTFRPADMQLDHAASGSDMFNAVRGKATVGGGHLWVANNDSVFYSDDLTLHNGMNMTAVSSIQYDNGSASYPLSGATSPAFYKDQLALALSTDNSLVIFAGAPLADSNNSGIILGASDFTATPSATCSADGLKNPQSVTFAGDKMMVADSGHNRVLIWNSVPTVSGTQPDLVIGQNSMNSCGGNDENQDGNEDFQPANRTLKNPTAVWSDGDKLLVLDSGNNRVLLWNHMPDENFAIADLVLGQPDFISAYENDGANDSSEDDPGDTTLKQALTGLDSNGKQIFVTDSGNNRILIWNDWPQQNGEGADIVLGQSDYRHIAANDDDQDCWDEYSSICGTTDKATLRTLNNPTGVYLNGTHLLVTDTGNNRVLAFGGDSDDPLEDE